MYRERELRASQLEARLAQSQLQVLRMQLHPHFLFNTLNTISELIHRAPDEAESMVTDLSDLLRLSLQTVGRQEVSLQQELDILDKYLQIDQYAIQAFAVHALDYLLKPFNHERFRQSLAHARKQLDRDESGALRHVDHRLLSLLEGIRTPQKYTERLVIKATGRVYFLKTEDIDWIEACGNYVTLHVGAETHLLRETLGHLENRLDPARFLRIHRSRLVHFDRIKELTPLFNGDYTVLLQSGDELVLSRTYRDRLQELIEKLS